jgi:hypothetical protein
VNDITKKWVVRIESTKAPVLKLPHLHQVHQVELLVDSALQKLELGRWGNQGRQTILPHAPRSSTDKHCCTQSLSSEKYTLDVIK